MAEKQKVISQQFKRLSVENECQCSIWKCEINDSFCCAIVIEYQLIVNELKCNKNIPIKFKIKMLECLTKLIWIPGKTQHQHMRMNRCFRPPLFNRDEEIDDERKKKQVLKANCNGRTADCVKKRKKKKKNTRKFVWTWAKARQFPTLSHKLRVAKLTGF